MPEENIGPSPRMTTHSDVGVVGGRAAAPRRAPHQLAVDRVALLRPVEDDVADRAAVLGDDDGLMPWQRAALPRAPAARFALSDWRRHGGDQEGGVVGCGLMGHGIAQVAAQAGYDVVVREVDQADAGQGPRQDREAARARRREGQGEQADADAVRGRITGHRPTTRDLADCDLVIEAITEDLEPSSRCGSELDEIVKPRRVLRHQHVVAAGHRPGRGDRAARALPRPALLQPRAGHEAASRSCARSRRPTRRSRPASSSPSRSSKTRRPRRKDKAGFIVNRLLVPYLLDAIRAYEEGVGSIDRDRRGDEGRRRPSDGPAHARRLRRPRHDSARSAT